MSETVLIAGHPTHLRHYGKGPRKVVALHCSLAHGGAFQPLAAALKDRLTLIAPDLPGHGRSAWAPTARDIHDLATAVATEVLAQNATEGPVDLIGHSFGGSVALRVALEAPHLLRSLTLIEPVVFAAARDKDGMASAPGVQNWLARQGKVDQLLQDGQPVAAMRLFNEDWGNGTPFEDIAPHQQAYMLERLHLIPAFSHIAWDDAVGMLHKGRLEALNIPTLLLAGQASPPIVAEINANLAARLPKARQVSVEGANHMLPLTHAGVVAQHICEHLDQA